MGLTLEPPSFFDHLTDSHFATPDTVAKRSHSLDDFLVRQRALDFGSGLEGACRDAMIFCFQGSVCFHVDQFTPVWLPF